ncbi:MAG: hypothetical protein HW380_3359 [Magnetococcales bacterium]|nr:hypothetical protein [Magnetococcales bacterium]
MGVDEGVGPPALGGQAVVVLEGADKIKPGGLVLRGEGFPEAEGIIYFVGKATEPEGGLFSGTADPQAAGFETPCLTGNLECFHEGERVVTKA